jgi:hypothetical protein
MDLLSIRFSKRLSQKPLLMAWKLWSGGASIKPGGLAPVGYRRYAKARNARRIVNGKF